MEELKRTIIVKLASSVVLLALVAIFLLIITMIIFTIVAY